MPGGGSLVCGQSSLIMALSLIEIQGLQSLLGGHLQPAKVVTSERRAGTAVLRYLKSSEGLAMSGGCSAAACVAEYNSTFSPAPLHSCSSGLASRGGYLDILPRHPYIARVSRKQLKSKIIQNFPQTGFFLEPIINRIKVRICTDSHQSKLLTAAAL